MPFIAVNLSQSLFDQVRALIENGIYKTFESFIEIAVYNQLALERGICPEELIEKGHRRAERDLRDPKSCVFPENIPQKQVTTGEERGDDAEIIDEKDEISKRFSLVNEPDHVNEMLSSPDEVLAKERVFGQVNRYFPLKIACRWLARFAIADSKWPCYEVISDALADDASTIGTILERWDIRSNRKRDDLLSTGLPRKGNSASRDRFLCQIIARITRAGAIYPAVICQYQLARFKGSTITLTASGMEFARIDNSILDMFDTKAPAALTSAESEFLAKQILTSVPTEREEMRIVLQAIYNGNTSPQELFQSVRESFPNDWSSSVFQTHVSGIVSRLTELRLIIREWQGRNVNYKITDVRYRPLFLKN